MTTRWLIGVCSLLVLCLPTPSVAQDPPSRLVANFDAFIEKAMGIGFTPGLGVAVVRGDEIVYAKGFGFADREANRRATADTQFYIASTTKSFTALAAAVLHERGALDLDASVDRYLPTAKWDARIDPRTITLRHLLTHTHGIRPGGPIDFRTAFTGEFNHQLLLELLAFHPPAPNGRQFAYSNLGYNIFSLALDERFAEGWKAIVEREVFAPLAMKSSTADISKADSSRLAMPYSSRATRPERIPFSKRDETMQAAGGHVSSAHDLARYLIAHLNQGRIDGRQALPAAAIEATHRQQATQERNFGPIQRFGWGLGWDIGTYEGDTLLHRFGGYPGFRSHVSFMPERKVGVVVLTNDGLASSFLTDVIATYIYDRLLQKPNIEAQANQRLESYQSDVRGLLDRERKTRGSRPQVTPLPLSAYAGMYESVALGRMIWSFNDGRLRAKWSTLESDVEVFDGAKYQLRVELTGGGSVVSFTVPDGASRPTAFRFSDYEFKRIGD
jgi:CubicO group peptidase (beta-lactamase class C family)